MMVIELYGRVQSNDDGDASAAAGSSKRGAQCPGNARQCPPSSTTFNLTRQAFNDPSSRPSSHLPTRHVISPKYLLCHQVSK